MAPKSILVMRHAEKPDDPYDPDLTEAGKERAKKLAAFIPGYFGAPDFIFAAAISAHTAQAYNTVVPLAKAIGLPIDATIATNDYAVLADKLLKDAKYEGSRVLVCWDSGDIPPFLAALWPGGSHPTRWDKKIFSLIIELKFDAPASRTDEAVYQCQLNRVMEPF